jgi:superfamily II DNA helicase RecQ
VYCHKRDETETIARSINQGGTVRARAYHGKLKKADRIEVQDLWSSGEIQVAVATIAFGMGIDRACVRYVIHWSLAKSIEGFYQ